MNALVAEKCRAGRRVLALVGLVASALAGGCDQALPTTSVAVTRAQLPPAPSARFVKLEELTEWNGHPWGSVAEFNLIDATGATLDRKGWRATSDSATAIEPASNAIDGDPNSIWHTAWQGENIPAPPHALTIDLGASMRLSGFRYLARQDKRVNGTIAQFRFYVSENGVDWGDPVATGDFTSMSSPMVEKTIVFAAQTPNRPPEVDRVEVHETRMGQPVSMRVRASDPDGDVLSFEASHLPPGLAIDPRTGRISGTPIVPGSQTVELSVKDPKGAATTLAFKWVIQPPAPLPQPLGAGEVRFVKLEALSEVEGRPWAAIAELDMLDAAGNVLPRTGWSASADSTGTADGAGNAIDGNRASLWHTRWGEVSAPYPHALVIDFGRGLAVHGFRMLPRQDGLTNGNIARFRFFTSGDGVHWGDPLVEGDFGAMPGGRSGEKTVSFEKRVRG